MIPYLAGEWPEHAKEPMKLRICPSKKSSHLWGSFCAGIVSGIIKSVEKAPTASGTSLNFFWRGSEVDGPITFDESNIGTIVFLGGGQIKGTLAGELFKECEFTGKKVEGLRVAWKKRVRGWKDEWRRYNWSRYEVERVASWGKWGGESQPDKPAESDTTDGGLDRDEVEELDI